MANTSNGKSGGFGLGPVVVVGLICFVLGYLAASFAPVLTGSKVGGTRTSTRSTTPRTDENAGRDVAPEEPTPEEEKAAEEAPAGSAAPKAPTP